MNENLAELWTYFAETSCRAYSPLYDRICRAVAARDDVLSLIAEAPPTAHLPTVLLGAVHYLLLGGLDHPLASVYRGESDADPGPLFADVCVTHRADIASLLATRHTNTNEVGRSAVLGPALTETARRAGRPLALVDVGCSAGLNLLCDHYLLDYGPMGTTGPLEAPVRLRCDVTGGHPPIAARLPSIVARVGIDRDPVDITKEENRRWLLACTWPDTGRVDRTRAALEELNKQRPRVIEGDAVDAIEDAVLELPADALPVIVTTWALAYLPVDRRRDFDDTLVQLAAEREVAWISGEGAGVVERFADVQAPSDGQGLDASVLGLIMYGPASVDADVLGFVHPHGSWIDWRSVAS